MYQDKQAKINKLRELLPKVINLQTEGEEILLKQLEDLKNLSSAEDVAKDLQKYVLPAVIYNRIPWFYEFLTKQGGNELCSFLAGDLSKFPKDISQLKAELEQERQRRVIPRWIVIGAVAITSIVACVGTGATIMAIRQTSTYETDIKQLNAVIQKNQEEMEALQAKVKELQGEIIAGRQSVAQAKQVVAQYKALEQKNKNLNKQLYRVRSSIPCRLLGICQ